MKLKRPLTSVQVKARLTAHKPPSWGSLLMDKLNRLSFPSLTQGAGKLTEAKRLAGILSIMRHNDPEITKSPIETEKQKDGSVRHKLAGKGCTCIMAEVGRRLVQAILDRETKFLTAFRKASKQQDPLRDIYLWMLRNYAQIEACHSKGEIFRLLKRQFPKRHIDQRSFHRTLAAVGLPLTKPIKKRTP